MMQNGLDSDYKSFQFYFFLRTDFSKNDIFYQESLPREIFINDLF